MNKTVNINLAGLVFHIDENAYDQLHTYLETLRNHFKQEEGGDEILTDIEARIAELFQERLKQREVVNSEDVSAIIGIMGEPSEYGAETEETEKKEERSRKKIDLRAGKRRRVFRDRTDRMIAGVCGGLSNYFNIDPLWLRILFITLLFMGGGFILYIILWIVIPEAKTTAERLEMKGKKVNIDNIEKNIKDELDILTDKVKDFDKKVTKNVGKQALSLAQQITDFFISIFSWIAKAIGSCFGVFAVGLGVIFLIFISSIFFSFGGLDIVFNQSENFNFIFSDTNYTKTFLTGILLLFIIPIIAVILTGMRLLFGTKIHNNYKIGMFILWIVGFVLIGTTSINASKEFKYKAYDTHINILPIESDTIYLKVNTVDHQFDNVFDAKGFSVSFFEEELIGLGMQLDIEKNTTNNVSLWKKTVARGKEKAAAKKIAEEIKFEYLIEDDELIFDDYFTIDHQKWRMQELELSLKIPEGTTVYLDQSLEDIIYDIKNTTDTWDYDMLGHYWKMEKEGLTCISCEDE